MDIHDNRYLLSFLEEDKYGDNLHPYYHMKLGHTKDIEKDSCKKTKLGYSSVKDINLTK